MFKKVYIMYIYTETSIHPGTGTAINNIIDNPIQRERHTNFPIIQGSTLKGVLKSYADDLNITQNEKDIIFGKEDRIGGISFTDAKILAYPVRSLENIFYWTTSPLVLERYRKDAQICGIDLKWNIPLIDDNNKAIISKKTSLSTSTLFLEDILLNTEKNENIDSIINDLLKSIPYKDNLISEKFKKDFSLISDNLFRDFVTLTTEIIARTRINEKGVVVEGALWYEEYIPSDTLMYSLILVPNRISEDINVIQNSIEKFNDCIINVGGDETTGKGFVRIKV